VKGVLNELALFAGAGGGILGSQLLKWRTVCAVEIDPFCQEILLRRQEDGIFPAFPIWSDVRTFNGKPWRGIVDVITAGFPCQAFSSAARGNNTAPDLWPLCSRIIGEVSPRFILAENVQKRAIIIAENDLQRLGYKTRKVAISAKDLGADHIRKRHWLLGYSDNHGQPVLRFDAETPRMSELCKSIWAAKPCYKRISNGLANRMDRIGAVGNGQVPAMVAIAWGLLMRSVIHG
jgi:DNA (cytosine-5)-methyltransferase 1